MSYVPRVSGVPLLSAMAIPEALGVSDDHISPADDHFISAYLGSMTTESGLVQGSPLLGFTGDPATWPAMPLMELGAMEPLGLAALPPTPATPRPDKFEKEVPPALPESELARPSSVRRVRSYSISDSHTEESFSPRNAAVRAPKHTASFSLGYTSPLIRLEAARRSSNGSVGSITELGASPSASSLYSSSSGAATRSTFDYIRANDGTLVRVESGQASSSYESSAAASPLASRGSSISSARIGESGLHSPISPTSTHSLSASPSSASPRLYSHRSSNPPVGSPAIGLQPTSPAVAAAAQAAQQQQTGRSLLSSARPHQEQTFVSELLNTPNGTYSPAGSPPLSGVKKLRAGSHSPHSTLQLALPLDNLGPLGPGIADGSLNSPTLSARSHSGGMSSISSTASIQSPGVFEQGFTTLASAASLSATASVAAVAASQPMTPARNEKTIRIKLVRQSHDGAYGLTAAQGDRPTALDRVSSVPENVRAAPTTGAVSAGSASPTHLSLSSLKVGSPRHSPIVAIASYSSNPPQSGLTPRPPTLHGVATHGGSPTHQEAAGGFSPTSPKMSPVAMSPTCGGLLKGRGGRQIKLVVANGGASVAAGASPTNAAAPALATPTETM